MTARIRPAALALVVVLAMTACGGDESVGDASVLEFDQDDAEAFGATTTTPTTAAPLTTTTTAPQEAAAVEQTTTTLPPEEQAVSIEVQILDTSPYFDPSVAAVPVGATIRFKNAGTGTYSVVSDTGRFDSGPLAPGEVWIYTADAPGRYNYSDGGRPFAVGQFEVVQ